MYECMYDPPVDYLKYETFISISYGILLTRHSNIQKYSHHISCVARALNWRTNCVYLKLLELDIFTSLFLSFVFRHFYFLCFNINIHVFVYICTMPQISIYNTFLFSLFVFHSLKILKTV